MTSFSLWWPEIVRFLCGFAVASMLAGAIYWIVHVKAVSKPELAPVGVMVAVFAGGTLLSTSTALGGGVDLAIFFILAAAVVLSPIQGFLEWKRNPIRASWTFQWGWSSAGYLALGLTGGLMNRVWEELTARYSAAISGQVHEWLWDNPGYLAGMVFAQLSISFYRWMIPNLRLRPGVDRPMQVEEDE